MDERARILELFRNLPVLNFDDTAYPTLKYAEPRLQRSQAIIQSYRGKRNNPKADTEEESATNEKLHALEELFDGLREGVSKLEYGRTSKADWLKYFRFASDRLIRNDDGKYVIQQMEVPPNKIARHDYVNWTQKRTNDWFLKELVPLLKDRPRDHVFLLGDPGAGKSTLMKYLINIHMVPLLQQGLIFSRFEFMKFYNQWHDADRDIRGEIADYISFIFLRDIVHSQAYVHEDTGLKRRQTGGFSTIEAITRTLRAASEYLPVEEDELIRAAVNIDDAITDKGLSPSRLRPVGFHARISLIRYFSRQLKFVLLLDGLDCISIEDQQFETERVRILNYLIDNRTRLTRFNVGEDMPMVVETGIVFVMRENTFFFHRDPESEVDFTNQRLFWVQNLDPQVALHNVVTRGAWRWAMRQKADDQRTWEFVRVVTDALLRTIQFINNAIGTGRRPQHILNLFAGNLRLLFTFLEKLVRWYVDDAVSSGEVRAMGLEGLEDALKKMTGEAGSKILRRRKYRIIEILLFSGLPWFENAIVARRRDELANFLSPRPKSVKGRLQDNDLHTGFVDNVFNYHVHAHRNQRDKHSLLEKVRIIQLLREQSLEAPEIAEQLLLHFGYKSPELKLTLTMMLRTQLLRAELVNNRAMRLTATDRGLLVVDHLSRTMSYMEHVFHQTVLPKRMIESINDPARAHLIDTWTANSIRNVFAFLTYLRHVENNKANGKSVPERFRIFDRTHQGVLRSIRRILPDPASRRIDRADDENDGGRKVDVALDARRKIERLVYQWDRQGILVTPKVVAHERLGK